VAWSNGFVVLKDDIVKHARSFLSLGRFVFFFAGNTTADEMLVVV
jgi:hypothetical protein